MPKKTKVKKHIRRLGLLGLKKIVVKSYLRKKGGVRKTGGGRGYRR